MCVCLNLLEPQSCGIGGEVPTLAYSAKDKKSYAISGMGWAPQEFSIDWCRDNGIDLIPGDGYLPITVPAVVDTWALALSRFGTMSYSQVLQPAIHLAEDGFPVYQKLHDSLASSRSKYMDLYPTTGEVYFPDGRVPEVGEILRNPDFAEMLKTMCRAEEAAAGKGRIAGIEAARDAFYKGPIAERIVAFIHDNPVEDASGVSPHRHAVVRRHGGMARRARRARHLQLPRPRRLEVPLVDPGPRLPAAARHPGGLRPARVRPQLRRLSPHPDRVRQARLRRQGGILRRPQVR